MIILLLLVSLIGTVYFFIKYRYEYWKRRGIPYPEPKFIFGNLTGRLFLDFRQMYRQFKKNKPFFGFFMMMRPALVVTDLDFIKTILIKDFECFQNRGNYHNLRDDPLTGHLLNAEGEYWKTLRSKLTPTFSSGKMKFMFPTVVEVGHRLSETIYNSIQGKAVELGIKDLMSRYTTDVIGTCAFGIECNSLNEPNSQFFTVGGEIFKITGTFFSRFCRFNWHSLGRLFHVRTHEKYMADFFSNLVRQTIDYREKNNIRRKDFMDILIDLKNSSNSMTFNEILAQCFVFFAAGYETSSTTMTFTLYELAQNLSIQEKLRKEINAVLVRYNGEVTYEALGEMTYLDQVINESLRLHSPAPWVFRVASKNYYVPELNFTIEKNTKVGLPYGEIHLDPDYYPNPEVFDPDRFTPEAVKKRHPMAFLPFGDGPRNCIGLRFGKMEAKIGLVCLLKNFKFSNGITTKVPIEMNWKSVVVLQPVDLWLKVEKI